MRPNESDKDSQQSPSPQVKLRRRHKKRKARNSSHNADDIIITVDEPLEIHDNKEDAASTLKASMAEASTIKKKSDPLMRDNLASMPRASPYRKEDYPVMPKLEPEQSTHSSYKTQAKKNKRKNKPHIKTKKLSSATASNKPQSPPLNITEPPQPNTKSRLHSAHLFACKRIPGYKRIIDSLILPIIKFIAMLGLMIKHHLLDPLWRYCGHPIYKGLKRFIINPLSHFFKPLWDHILKPTCTLINKWILQPIANSLIRMGHGLKNQCDTVYCKFRSLLPSSSIEYTPKRRGSEDKTVVGCSGNTMVTISRRDLSHVNEPKKVISPRKAASAKP